LEQQAEFEAAGTPKDEYDQWEVINVPAIAEKDEKYRKKGEPLWPEKFSLPDLMTLRNGMDVYDWSALYQQEPILSEDAVFQSDWFKYFTESDIYQKSLQVFVTVDPAIGQRETSDNTSIMVVGKDRLAPEWYLLEENTGKMDPGQIVDFLFFLKGKYKDNLVSVGIEAVAYQKSLLYYVNERMVKTEQYFDVQEIKAKGSKEERIKGLVPLFKNGVILFRQSYKELEREFLQFPKGKHDDRIDSLSMQLQLMPQTKRNFFAPQWRPHLKRY
jgi:predicted phage terminase large subunit-like protein